MYLSLHGFPVEVENNPFAAVMTLATQLEKVPFCFILGPSFGKFCLLCRLWRPVAQLLEKELVPPQQIVPKDSCLSLRIFFLVFVLCHCTFWTPCPQTVMGSALLLHPAFAVFSQYQELCPLKVILTIQTFSVPQDQHLFISSIFGKCTPRTQRDPHEVVVGIPVFD